MNNQDKSCLVCIMTNLIQASRTRSKMSNTKEVINSKTPKQTKSKFSIEVTHNERNLKKYSKLFHFKVAVI
jgi:hypothetical protein